MADEVIQGLERELTEAKRSGSVARMVEAHVELGSFWVHRGQPFEALEMLDSAQEMLQSKGENSVRDDVHALLYVNMGLALGFRSMFDQAREAHARALVIAERADLSDLLFRSRVNVGYSHLQMGDTAAAMHAYHGALAGLSSDYPIYGFGLIVIADLFIEMGDFEAADRRLNEAILFLTPKWIGLGQHRIQVGLARILGRTGEPEQAIQLLEATLADREMTDTVGHASAWVAMADLALYTLDINLLRRACDNAYALVPETWLPPTALVKLVEALFEVGDHVEAAAQADRLDVAKLPYLIRHRLLEARRKLSIEQGDWESAYRFLLQTMPGVPHRPESQDLKDEAGVIYRMSRDLSNVVELSARHAELRRDVAMAQTAAHDLRTPFQSTLLLVGMLRREVGNQFNESFELLVKEVRRAELIANEMTEHAVTSQPAGGGSVQVLDCQQAVLDVLSRIKPILDGKQQTVSLTVVAPDPTVELDPELFERILDNLLSNASKYSEAGTQIDVTISNDGPGWVTLVIADQGLGFTANDLARAFGYQRTLSASPTGGESASGLGLYITKRMVDRAGGTISISSPGPNLGSTVTVSLPRVASEES